MDDPSGSAMSAQVRTYRVGPWRRWSLWYVLGPVLVGLIWLGAVGSPVERRSFMITAGLVGCIGILFQLVIGRTRLEFSPEGVRLRQTGYALAAAWSDIADLRLTPGREGFVTREPMKCRGARVLASFRGFAVLPALPFYDPDQQRLLAERRFIPIDAFAWHLHHGRMREDIARSAPQLKAILFPE